MQTNRFEVSGYLAAKPELRKLPSGTPVANVRLGQTYLYDTKEGRGKQTNWFNLAFYGALATIATNYEKGDNINIVGSIQQRQFTPKDGSTRTVQEVVVQKCHRIAAQREAVSASTAVSDVNAREDESLSNQHAVPENDDAWAIL
jgi:single-strand DNA-binding protein